MNTLPKKISITIANEDCVGRNYFSNAECPLARILQNMYPDTDIIVGGSFADIQEVRYGFSYDIWNIQVMDDLLDGKIQSVTIKLIKT